MVIVAPPGIDPEDELWYERVSDDEFIASQVAGGLEPDYAAAVLEILRGEGEPAD